MSILTRENANGLIPEEVSKEIISGVRKSSVAMQLMRQLPNMSTKTRKMPVLSLLPSADFVDGDAGMKITTNAEWKDKQIVAGEIAAIIPIPDAVLDDADYDIWAEVKPLLIEAFGRVFDNQVFNGGNPKAPPEWPEGIIPRATALGNTVTIGTGLDLLDDINSTMGLLEEMEYDITGVAAQKNVRTALRGLRDANNGFLFNTPTSGSDNNPYGVPIHFVGAGAWDRSKASAVIGDWAKAVFAMRQDITFEIFKEGVVSDDDGKVVYNLMMQDMKALRAVMRVGWQVANPIDIDRPDINNTFPFSLLLPAQS